eukprot:3440562-Rhodomonas_salina.1
MRRRGPRRRSGSGRRLRVEALLGVVYPHVQHQTSWDLVPRVVRFRTWDSGPVGFSVRTPTCRSSYVGHEDSRKAESIGRCRKSVRVAGGARGAGADPSSSSSSSS